MMILPEYHLSLDFMKNYNFYLVFNFYRAPLRVVEFKKDVKKK